MLIEGGVTRRSVSRSGVAAAAAMSLSTAAVALIGATPNSPFHPMVANVEPGGAIGRLAQAVGLQTLSGTSLAIVGLVAMACAVVSFCYAAYVAWCGKISLWVVLALAVVFHAVMVALPLLFSNDVPSYIIYGRIVSVHHANPYVARPSAFASDPFFRFVDPQWRGTTSVYGPLFTRLSAWLTSSIGTVPRLVLAFKAIAGVASLAALAIVVSVVRRVAPDKASFAAVVMGWNPVLLFNGVGSGHNDLLVALGIAAALALLYSKREFAASAVLTLAMLVKISAGLPLLIVVVVAVARRHGRARWAALAGHLAVVIAITATVSFPFFQAHNPTLGALRLSLEQRLAPERVVRHSVESLARRATDPAVAHTAGLIVSVAFELVLLAALVLVLRELIARGRPIMAGSEGAAWGWALLFLILTAPALLPWYVVWILPVVWLLPKVPRLAAIGLSAAMALWEIPASVSSAPHVNNAIRFVTGHTITMVAIGFLAWLAIDLSRRATAADNPATQAPDHP